MKAEASNFLDLLQSYFNNYLPSAVGASPNTIKSYKYAFRLLMEFLYSHRDIPADGIRFIQLDYETMVTFLNWLESDRHCSASTKNQRLSALLSFSQYAQNRDFEAASVFRDGLVKIPVKKTIQKQRAVFTVSEVTCLLSLPDDRVKTGCRDKVILSIMYASGARAQEICDLTVGDIQSGSNGTVLILHGKGYKVRRIGIPASCAKMLSEYTDYREIRNSPRSHVFSSQTHEHMTVSCIEGIFNKYVTTARKQYPDMFKESSYPPHSMRHSTASHMLEAGVPLVVIKNFLGHASLQSTQIYAELSQNTVDKHLREWSEKWFTSEMDLKEKEAENRLPVFLDV